MREYLLSMEKHGIGRERMRELMSVCRQYGEMRRRLNDARSGVRDAPPAGNSPGRIYGDPTGSRAARTADSYDRRRVRAIEDSARAAGGRALWRAVLKSATQGLSWERLGPPCGRRQFYALRRAFYVELDRRLRD